MGIVINIIITEAAVDELEKLENKFPNHFRFLQYEMGGCGLPLDGVLRLQLIKLNVGFEQVQTNWKLIYLNKSSLDFLDDNLTIDYSDGFQIKSSNQTYSHNLPIEIEE